MDRIPTISDAEWKVMKLLWGKSPQPAYDLVQALSKTEDWNPRTVKSLLNRLVKKEALGFKIYKNLYLYYPLVEEVDCVHAESESFLNQVFDGSLRTMLLHFSKYRRLSSEEIKELKSILQEQENKNDID